ncbi:MAG: TonB C-terminal domain-containing protein, partial [Myxococcota bacterium]|nr:TonB C-terminal domain-containing protein [Myxococcota bacterium]
TERAKQTDNALSPAPQEDYSWGMVRPRPKRAAGRSTTIALVVSLLLHLPLLWWFVDSTYLRPAPEAGERSLKVSLPNSKPEEQTEENKEDEPEEHQGQIVEIAPPKEEEKPEKADYLAEHDSTVPEESVDPRYRVDRTVTAESYSPEEASEFEQQEGLDTPDPHTGTVAGREVFRRGNYSLFPDRKSKWNFETGEGIAAPAPSRSVDTRLAGSPSNDYLPNEAVSERTALNAHKTLYASWWNRVKRLVSFYADQTLDNARPRVPLRQRKYEVVLSGLIAADGSLGALDIDQTSGIPEFDEAIRQAFELAAPFPEPPDGAVEPDDFVHMDKFSFVITVGSAQAEMTGIDPRQNIQFPGLQTVPR